ncbi:MAG: hypothetical protein ACJA1P_001968 [Maribacter sp.]|jgi:hypothetical protein
MEKNKTVKYFKYAIGEIVLVVIGILIALSINNWNENRKEKRNLNQVYKQIQKDLQTDTLEVFRIIDIYKEKNQRLTDIIERSIPISYYDTINESNYSNCKKCFDDVAYAEPFQNLNKGYQLFKSLNIDQNNKTDSLSFKIDTFYKDYNATFLDINKILLNLVNEKIDDNQKYDWFIEWSVLERGKYNKNFVTYLFENEDYRTKSARHLIYSKYYLRNLIDYKNNSIKILTLLDKKLK